MTKEKKNRSYTKRLTNQELAKGASEFGPGWIEAREARLKSERNRRYRLKNPGYKYPKPVREQLELAAEDRASLAVREHLRVTALLEQLTASLKAHATLVV